MADELEHMVQTAITDGMATEQADKVAAFAADWGKTGQVKTVDLLQRRIAALKDPEHLALLGLLELRVTPLLERYETKLTEMRRARGEDTAVAKPQEQGGAGAEPRKVAKKAGSRKSK